MPMRTCPVVRNAPVTSRCTAASSRVASSSTTAGSLPPSSSVTRVRFLAAVVIMYWPAAVLPVKTIFWTRRSSISGATASLSPVTTFSTPGGSPRASRRSVSTTASGLVGGGLTITGFPATSA